MCRLYKFLELHWGDGTHSSLIWGLNYVMLWEAFSSGLVWIHGKVILSDHLYPPIEL